MSRHTVYDERAGILLGQIIATCYEISTKTKADVFFSHSPQVSAICISVYPNGWTSSKESDDSSFYIQINKGSYLVYFGDTVQNDVDDFIDDKFNKMGIEPLQKVYEQLEALKKQYMEDANNEKD